MSYNLPLISVVVPVYNIEKYIYSCLDSILSSDYDNLQIIVVDDGSTDSCSTILANYVQTDPRIVLIHKKNGGLSDARNAGLSAASGDYIMFIDGDDMISSFMISSLYKCLIETGSDIVQCNYLNFSDSELISLEKSECNLSPYELVEGMEDILEQHLLGKVRQVVWNKLYKKKVLENVLFPFGKINEDEFWTYKVLSRADRICIIKDELYFYRQQNESIMGRGYSSKRLDAIEALQEKFLFIEKNHSRLKNLSRLELLVNLRHHYFLAVDNQLSEESKQIANLFIQYFHLTLVFIYPKKFVRLVIFYNKLIFLRSR